MLRFLRYDPYARALAKLERGHERDRSDAREMLDRVLVAGARLGAYCTEIEPELFRYRRSIRRASTAASGRRAATERQPAGA